MATARRFRWGLIVPALVLAALVAWLVFQPKPVKKTAPPAVPVTAAQAQTQDVPVAVNAIGAALAWQAVTIQAQVSGVLKAVYFTEGTDVAKGQLLAQIDPAPFQAALTQAEGALDRDQALLQEARLDLARYQKLASQDSIAKQQVDAQAALVKQDEGVVKVDQGAVATARINLGYCRITAPVSGRVGLRLVDPGNLVTAGGATGLLTVNQIEPIAVTFTVPEGDFQRLAEVSKGFTVPLTTQAMSEETGAPLGQGQLSIADNHVDSTNGTVAMKARFANAQHKLWPGQFVNVRLTLQVLQHAVTIPVAAVNQGPKGAFAYVIGPDHKVSARPLKVGATQDGLAVIDSGLKAGESVVTDGQMSLKPGLAVAVHAAAPAAGKPAA
jgi:multidrug efflux system membrane fusion protein